MSKLLVDEHPLLVLPSLAIAIGLNEAMMLQQVHYWLEKATNEREGKKWVYKTYPEWQMELPFWSLDTVKRTIRSLEKAGLIAGTDEYNPSPTDRTKWYTIDYEALHKLEEGLLSVQKCTLERAKMHGRGGQIAPLEEGKLHRSYLLQRLHTETTKNSAPSEEKPEAHIQNDDGQRQKKQPYPCRPRDMFFEDILKGSFATPYTPKLRLSPSFRKRVGKVVKEVKEAGDITTTDLAAYYGYCHDAGITPAADGVKLVAGVRRLKANGNGSKVPEPNDAPARPRTIYR